MKLSCNIRLVKSDFVVEQWDGITSLLQKAFAGSSFSDGFNPGRPAQHTWEEIHKEGGSELEHVVALNADGRLIGAAFCLPTKRPAGATSCDLGWFFVDTNLGGLQRARIADAVVSRGHEELAKSGYHMVVTEMGTDSGASYLSMRHGYAPAPVEGQANRWIRSLRTPCNDEINRKSVKRSWTSAGDQEGRYATTDIAEDEIIIDLKPLLKRAKHRSAYTLQLAEGLHYRSSVGPLGMNHACGPNSYIRFEDLTYRALKGVAEGEELTFHYCTTEYELANPFNCLCGSPVCLGRVRGFRYLDKGEVEKIAPHLSPFIRSKL